MIYACRYRSGSEAPAPDTLSGVVNHTSPGVIWTQIRNLSSTGLISFTFAYSSSTLS